MLENENDLSLIKIVDFGLSAQFNQNGYGNSVSEHCGTLLYMAPELISFKSYSKVRKFLYYY